MYMAFQSQLSLFASGRINGLVMDLGEGVSQAVPIYEGYAVHEAVSRSSVGGSELTTFLKQYLRDRGYEDFPRGIVKKIKESLAHVIDDFEMEYRKSICGDLEKCYELPDGCVITVAFERFICAEALFHPKLLNIEDEGIQTLAYQSIIKCDLDIRKELFHNIVLSGGTSLIANLDDRLLKDVVALVPLHTKVKVIAPSERKYSAWTGGSILANLNSFQDMWITKHEYDEHGSGIINKKCF
ncbi:hypothetical protein RFI_24017 [Reticulomyxa filosa]|uniref:Actin n=1 Tax=Reticulomyxa filosa TaxID=46433 RepID=X6MIA9_RETFI|nr:hypothetical protein RFI_24017 [Reticulomyxa filosa]|eukprot:ETO13361.1 hypothetical protein RFI_24017 [Reticulomyxa filosa]